jgi:hypothetical protein
MRIDNIKTNIPPFMGICTNTLPRLTDDQKRELEYIKNKCEASNYARLHK